MASVSRGGMLFLFAALSGLVLAGCARGSDPEGSERPATAQAGMNTVSVDGAGNLRWNGTDITLDELAGLLEQTRQMPTEPQLQFLPSAEAPYETSADVLRVIMQSGITKFGFVGNEKHRVPERSED